MRAGGAAVDTDVLVHLSSVFATPSKPVLGPVLRAAQGLHPGWGLIIPKGQVGFSSKEMSLADPSGLPRVWPPAPYPLTVGPRRP